MSSRTAAAAAIITLGLAFVMPAQARPACQTEPELAAMQFRQLQIEFMVATLKCGGTGYDFRGRYAEYVTKAQPYLADNARLLKAMFARQGKGAAYMDRYLTGMSNDAQTRSQSTENYCQAAADSLERAITLRPHELPAYAATAIAAPYAATPCSSQEHKPQHMVRK